jgi:dTDP-4-amino-4,6-dideoxygalactose transaminase
LTAKNWPAGGEVLMTCLNIPDMARVVEAHGLVPVPVDVDPATLAPSRAELERRYTDRTLAVLVAHLFGGHVPLEEMLAFASDHGIPVIEDCAQAYQGSKHRGDPRAEISMFSFGAIKTATALGGALLAVRDGDLLERMRRLEAVWPLPAKTWFLRRAVKFALLKLLEPPAIYGGLHRLLRCCGCDVDAWIAGAARGFPGGRLLEQIRRQPPRALLRLIARRLLASSSDSVRARQRLGAQVAARLPAGLTAFGSGLRHHTYWVFPVVASEPEPLVRRLRAFGFDAHRRATLALLSRTAPELSSGSAACSGRRSAACAFRVAECFDRLVYVPVDARMSNRTRQRLLQALAAEGDATRASAAAAGRERERCALERPHESECVN